MGERSVGNTMRFRFYDRDLMHKNLSTNGNLKYSSVAFHVFYLITSLRVETCSNFI
jgi:hypothetical protein